MSAMKSSAPNDQTLQPGIGFALAANRFEIDHTQRALDDGQQGDASLLPAK
jgi:hypothetical protein